MHPIGLRHTRQPSLLCSNQYCRGFVCTAPLSPERNRSPRLRLAYWQKLRWDLDSWEKPEGIPSSNLFEEQWFGCGSLRNEQLKQPVEIPGSGNYLLS